MAFKNGRVLMVYRILIKKLSAPKIDVYNEIN